jgi:hypothetical protein
MILKNKLEMKPTKKTPGDFDVKRNHTTIYSKFNNKLSEKVDLRSSEKKTKLKAPDSSKSQVHMEEFPTKNSSSNASRHLRQNT